MPRSPRGSCPRETRRPPRRALASWARSDAVPDGVAPGPVHDLGNVLRKGDERVIAALDHRMQGALVERDRLAVVEHFVGGLEEDPVAFGSRDGNDIEKAQLLDMLRRENERFPGVEVALRAEMTLEVA